ncbi:MAG: pyridoxal-phosphate dependent enzyme [Dongiaceae bacterium]
MIDLHDIEVARERIAGWVRRTPTTKLAQLKAPPEIDAAVTLKLEALQVTGSFKARGAMNRLRGGTSAPRALVTASGGNHGVAVARTAFVAGIPATIFVSRSVAADKIRKIEAWNGTVEVVGSEWTESNEAALAHADRTGATYFHPFADPLVVAGQGTLGLEILEDMRELDLLLVAIGGGGLIAGISTAVRALRPAVRIVGIEPQGSPTIRACLDAGRLVALPEVTSRVATMSCRKTDERIFEIARRNVDDIVLVSDDAMQDAARWLWSEMAVAADLSGAASIAALRSGAVDLAGAKHVCALVCGAGPDGLA